MLHVNIYNENAVSRSSIGTIHYVYDLVTGRHVETWTGTGPDNSSSISDTTYGYDPAGRLTTVNVTTRQNSTAASIQTTYNYDADGNLLTMVEPNVPTGPGITDIVTATYQYDDLNRLTSLSDTTASATTLYSFTYTYRADGLRTSSTEQVNGSTNTTSWTYDNLDRLTTETYSSTGSPSTNYSATYTYDNVGNRLTEVLVNGSNTTSTTDTYDARDRLTGETVTTNGSPTSATTDTYDSNGSLVQSQTTSGTQTTTNTYSYDARGRLLTAKVNGGSAKQEVG